MRILQVSSARAFGGGERHFADLVAGLARRGHQVTAALRRDSPLREEVSGIISDENILTLPLRNSLDLPSALRLARFARARGVELIHAHAARDYPPAALAARLSGARLVVTRHVLFPLGRAHRLVLADASRLIAVSDAVARALVAQKIFPERKMRVVQNAVDAARLERVADGLDRAAYRAALGARAPLVVGTLGELSEVKGQEDFVRAASEVARRREDVEFFVLGEDASREGRNRAALERLITELGLEARVRPLGRRADAGQVLACLDVYVSASRSEAFGLATLEAMACGAAVVATDTEGSREVVEDGVTGLLVPVRDVRAIAEAVTRLLEDEELRAQLSSNARRRARERWGLERMVGETERVYAEAVEAG